MLRTIPVLEQFAEAMERFAPDAWFLNYTNLGVFSQAICCATRISRRLGFATPHVCAKELLEGVGLEYDDDVTWKIAGINHMAWLLEIKRNGKDLYPEIKRLSREGHVPEGDKVRHDLMQRFGYYITESSEHNAEYHPYYIKEKYPELIERYNIPLDEYPRRCVHQIESSE